MPQSPQPPSRPELRERLNVSRWCLRHPRATIAVWVLVVLGGCLAFSRLQYALLPDVTFPVIVVDVTAPFPSAPEVEARVASPIERALSGTTGLDDIRSSSFPGRTVVSAAFLVGEDLTTAHGRVATRLRRVTLPAGARVWISEVNLNETSVVTYVLLDTTRTPDQLAAFARRVIVPPLAHVDGVLDARLIGVGSTAVRLNRTNGVAIQIIKQAGANTLGVSHRVTAMVARLVPILHGARLVPVADQAEYIAEATRATIEALVIAIVLSVLVIFPFLSDWHATAISALAIPTSLLGTGIVMAWAGFELETITLLALAIVIGIIVDDAIVDVENIARHIELGQEPTEAAALATDEIGLTVTAATLTIVAVFLPVGLMSGVIGRFFRPFGLTISAAVITSLLVARTLSPVLAAWWLKRRGLAREATSARWQRVVTGYERMLDWSLRHRLTIVAVAIASFVAGLAIIPFIPRGFIPRLDRGEFLVQYDAPLGTPLAQSAEIARQIEDSIVTQRGVMSVYSIAGNTSGETNTGTLRVRLDPSAHLAAAQMEERLRARLPNIAGVTMSVGDIPFVDVAGQKPFEIAVTGRVLADVQRGAQAFANRLRRDPGLVDVSVSGVAMMGECAGRDRSSQRFPRRVGHRQPCSGHESRRRNRSGDRHRALGSSIRCHVEPRRRLSDRVGTVHQLWTDAGIVGAVHRNRAVRVVPELDRSGGDHSSAPAVRGRRDARAVRHAHRLWNRVAARVGVSAWSRQQERDSVGRLHRASTPARR